MAKKHRLVDFSNADHHSVLLDLLEDLLGDLGPLYAKFFLVHLGVPSPHLLLSLYHNADLHTFFHCTSLVFITTALYNMLSSTVYMSAVTWIS